eukprot:gene12077-biopygen4908
MPAPRLRHPSQNTACGYLWPAPRPPPPRRSPTRGADCARRASLGDGATQRAVLAAPGCSVWLRTDPCHSLLMLCRAVPFVPGILEIPDCSGCSGLAPPLPPVSIGAHKERAVSTGGHCPPGQGYGRARSPLARSSCPPSTC